MKIVPLETVPTTTPSPEIPFQDASLDIWDKKYRLKTKEGEIIDRDIDATYQRVAKALAAVELTDELRQLWYEKFLWALRHGAIPAGRIVSNAGALAYKPATSTINCTVSGYIGDSMDNILAKVHEAGLTLKAGCGIGYEFSTLRPKGAYVSGAGAYTSGPLSFMDIYDKMCFTVSSAGGRRGAQMATFDIGHPDVVEFIRAKREDGRLRQFNLSLLITQDFMKAVQEDGEWPLAFPILEKERDGIDLNDPGQVVWRDWPATDGYITNASGQVACKIYRRLRARRLWDVIMTSTYDYAEPGFILIDKVNEMNNNWFVENIRATNPCVTADTWVHTATGPRQVRELIGKPFHARLDGRDHATTSRGFFKTATRPVKRLVTAEGYTLRLTADHPLRRVVRFTDRLETEWTPVHALRPGDCLQLNNHRPNTRWPGFGRYEDGYLVGLVLTGAATLSGDSVTVMTSAAATADGSVTPPSGSVTALLAAVENISQRLSTPATSPVRAITTPSGDRRFPAPGLTRATKELGVTTSRCMTPSLEKTSSDFYRGFLRSFFDIDGSVDGDLRNGIVVRLADDNAGRLSAVQRMLLRLGIGAAIRQQHREPGTGRPAATKTGKRRFELLIRGDNLTEFMQKIGFSDPARQSRLNTLLTAAGPTLTRERFVARVVTVEDDGTEDVYDVQIPGPHAFDGNGLHTHNCGEQPLPPYGSCLLGSVNLTRFVRKPFTDEATFDWQEYRQTVAIFTRMLDNVVEINGLPLEQQRHEIYQKRRHGMGYLGLGSTLTMLRMKYGSPESLRFTETVTKELALVGWRVALDLAKEKGPAPLLEQTFTVTEEMLRKRPEMKADGYKVGDKVPGKVLHARYSRYMQQIAQEDPDLVDALAEIGARFTHHSSIAPTGTISLSLANNASNGIEPSFAHHYFRNVIREGRKTKEKVPVYSYELLTYRELINPKATPEATDPGEALPDYFVTAEDITPKAHVDIQAAAQKWIDSSISKTANVPTDFAYEDFKDIYLYAYECGLKGCTTFRFNPEAFQGVLVKEKDLENTTYQFTLDDNTVIEVKGNEEIEYDGEIHTAANLYDALKEGYYGKF